MPIDANEGAKLIQLITSRYNQREWRKKIEKTLSLTPNGIEDEIQRKIFLYFKVGLQAYKSRRADAPSWIVGGFATKEVVDRARHNPTLIDPAFGPDEVATLGVDPGEDIDQVWWDEMLVKWFEGPEDVSTETMLEADQEQEYLDSESEEESSSGKTPISSNE